MKMDESGTEKEQTKREKDADTFQENKIEFRKNSCEGKEQRQKGRKKERRGETCRVNTIASIKIKEEQENWRKTGPDILEQWWRN
jgi:hypothetical protein